MQPVAEHDLVLVVDFGAQYAQLIARRVREARVYSEIVPHSMPIAEMLAKGPKAVILSGGPSSVYAEGAPGLDPALFDADVPVFGMCYGFQLMAQGLGGEVAHTGRAGVRPHRRGGDRCRHPAGRACPAEHTVWMSHGDSVTAAPEGFRVLASTDVTPVAAFESLERRMAGRAVAPRGDAHPARSAGARALPAPDRRLPADLDDGQHRRGADRGDPRPDRRPRPGDLRAVRRRRLRRRGGPRAARDRRPADLRLRRPRADAQGRDRAGRARLRGRHRRRPQGGRRGEAVPRRPRGRLRPRGEAQDHRPRVHPGLRGRRGRGAGRRRGRRRRRQGRVPRAGHALPRRRGVRRRRRHLQHQVPPQRRRAARRPGVRAGRAAAHPVQGRGAPGRRAARPARRDRLAAPVPRPRAGHPDHRRGHPRAARHPPRGRRDRPRGAHPRRARPRHLAVPRGAARRRPLRRRPGRRPHLRPPGRAPPGHLRGRDDRRLGPAALRRARADLHPDHQRGPRDQPGHRRHHLASPRAPSSGSRPDRGQARADAPPPTSSSRSRVSGWRLRSTSTTVLPCRTGRPSRHTLRVREDELEIALRVLEEAGGLDQDDPSFVALRRATAGFFKAAKRERRRGLPADRWPRPTAPSSS